jgi:predicted nuclease of predicted toxin-antitoxin system
MKVLVDMNLSPRWLALLTEADLEAVHGSTLGAGNASHSEIMAYARANDYVVLTHDLDFAAILAATQGKKLSVVQVRAEQLNPQVIGSRSSRLSGKWKWNSRKVHWSRLTRNAPEYECCRWRPETDTRKSKF